MKRLTNLMLAALICLFALYSCKSDVDLTGGTTDIPDGEATVKLDFQFEGLDGALSTRGVNGDLNFRINNMIVLFYKGNADEENDSPLYWGEFNQNELEQFLEERKDGHCEEKTYHGHVSLDVPYGTYRIYCVANVPTDMFDNEGYRTEDADGNVTYALTEKQLREIQIAWPEYPATSGSDDIPVSYGIPDAMFGYFTYDDEAEHSIEAHRNVIHHNLALYPGKKESFDKNNPSLALDHKSENRAPKVTLDKKHIEIQAWLKRVVSKLTIGFDGSGLKNGVEIYIKSVSIRDVAATCFLGHDNSVGDANDVKVNEVKTEVKMVEYDPNDPRLNIVYDENEGISDWVLSKKYPAFPREDKYDEIDPDPEANGKWNEDWYDYVHGSLENTNPLHNDQPITLYFMENLQGVVTKDNPDPVLGENPKLMTKESVGHFGSAGHADEATEDCTYYKDGRKDGTYIEVKAYYKNSKKNTEGDITYRFMLGKNVTNDFNAERNCHYKLILSFLGDANDVDWHIEYKEKQRPEGFYFRIPYNIEDGMADTGYSDEPNKETWYQSENWNQSYVWYAYDEAHEPIAEIVKELVYWDENDSEYNKRHSQTNRDYYQVVSVYPVKKEGDGKYVTDFANGLIVQVLACDTKEIDKKANGRVSMLTRDNKNTTIDNDGPEGYRGYYVITSLNWGSDEDETAYNYVYVSEARDEESGEYELTFGTEPRQTILETGAYQVEDTDKNHYYPVVKIGTAYWLRENLMTTTYSTDVNQYNKIHPVGSKSLGDNDYGPVDEKDGWIGYYERYPMYKENNGKGYLYNFMAISGMDAGDFEGDYSKTGEGEAYIDLVVQKQDSDENWIFAGMLQQEGAGYWSEIKFGEGTYEKYGSYNLQIAPTGWHITTSSDAHLMSYIAYTGMFNEARSDHDYLEEYIDVDWNRVICNQTVDNASTLTKNNLTGLSLYIQDVSGGNSYSFEQLESPEKVEDNMVFPYWTDLLASDPVVEYHKESGGAWWTGNNFCPNPPFLRYPDVYGSITSRVNTHAFMGSTNTSTFWADASKLYLPVRCVRDSFSYEAPAYDGSNDRYVKIINE